MSGHAQLKFVMTECSKTQIRLTGLIYDVAMESIPNGLMTELHDHLFINILTTCVVIRETLSGMKEKWVFDDNYGIIVNISP